MYVYLQPGWDRRRTYQIIISIIIIIIITIIITIIIIIIIIIVSIIIIIIIVIIIDRKKHVSSRLRKGDLRKVIVLKRQCWTRQLNRTNK